jgi:hypothetical protein
MSKERLCCCSLKKDCFGSFTLFRFVKLLRVAFGENNWWGESVRIPLEI